MNLITKENSYLIKDDLVVEEGFAILIDKEPDWTSFDVVNKLKRILKIKKIGHAGTLDPFATGLLIVCVKRSATKRISEFQNMPKIYSGIIQFGEETDTYDLTGKTISRITPDFSEEELRKVIIEKFTGEISQLPPAYSALKVNGKRAYELARKGEKPDLKARQVTIYDFKARSYDFQKNTLSFEIKCSVGTYIRSIAHDLGKVVGCNAHLKVLRRETIGDYSVNNAFKIEELLELINND